MTKIVVTTRDDSLVTLDDPGDATLMEALRDADVDDSIGLCGGVASCATCHVYIEEPELAALPEIDEDEEDILSSLDNRQSASRLACQVPLSDLFDELRISMPADD